MDNQYTHFLLKFYQPLTIKTGDWEEATQGQP